VPNGYQPPLKENRVVCLIWCLDRVSCWRSLDVTLCRSVEQKGGLLLDRTLSSMVLEHSGLCNVYNRMD